MLMNSNEYLNIVESIKQEIRTAQYRATVSVNRKLLVLYHSIGEVINEHKTWGNKFVENLAADIKMSFPDTTGYSVRNLKYMAKFALRFPEKEIVQAALAQITWYHHIALMDKVKNADEHIWYAEQVAKNGWSRNVLVHQIESGLYQRQVLAEKVSNFESRLPSPQSELAAQTMKDPYIFDFTFGLAHTFKTSLGATINLNAGGDYGWCIDKEETTQALLQAIEDETQGNLDPVYLYTANDRSANDIGNTYVEVCISQQKMWCYKDGVLVTETPVTTGNHATGYDTPAGSVWAVDAKKSDCDFKLYPSHVMFWLPFNGDVGIHDASWRTEYGGDIYLTNGSHGCVNTPYTEAEKVFNAIEIGDPVIVYYSLDDVTGPQPTQKNSL